MYKETFDIVFVIQGLQKFGLARWNLASFNKIQKWYSIVDLYEQNMLLRSKDIET